MNARFVGRNGYEPHTADEIEELLTRDDGFVWLDLPRWDEAVRPILADTFHLHPLAIADCEERNRVPKMHAYADHALIVVHAPERGRRGHVHYIELDLGGRRTATHHSGGSAALWKVPHHFSSSPFTSPTATPSWS